VLQEAWGEISSDWLSSCQFVEAKVCKAVIAANTLTKAKFEGHN
jgi:hypothetical protein